MKKVLVFILSIFFVTFSFAPSLYEIYHVKDLPGERVFVLEHNYMFDYNFYLSRIRQGQEGRWLVSEKYYNRPHKGSLMQVFYLYLGKIGGLFGLSPPLTYHLSRLLLGLMLLLMIGGYTSSFFSGPPFGEVNWWGMVAFLLIVTSGSWPIPVKLASGGWRFATYMGWWSAVDSLQRITFIPHVVFGQIYLLLFIWVFGTKSLKELRLLKLIGWGIGGFLVGIVFPPTLIVVYTVFGILSVLELVFSKSLKELKALKIEGWIKEKILPRIVFILLSFPALFYLQLIFKVMPWRALALFDIEHRMPLPYREYAYALGPVLPLGMVGLIVAFAKKEKKLLSVVSWILGLFLLFAAFEHVPQQSPLRFTEGLIHIPLGILATYLFWSVWQAFHKYSRSWRNVEKEEKGSKIGLVRLIGKVGKIGVGGVVFFVIVMGLLVMGSMVGWLTDQAYGKRVGTWLVPIGAQLVYPLEDFMNGVYFLRDNTSSETVVLGYVTSSNFIPAYAGNYTYIGHANTPDEWTKNKIVEEFFVGKMDKEKAEEFLKKERISYIYFGPQERELGNVGDLGEIYPFVKVIYENKRVKVYRVE